MKNLLLIPLLAIGGASAIGSIPTPPVIAKPAAATGWKTFTQAAYSLRYPADWQEIKANPSIEVPVLTYPFTAVAPLASDESKFRSNINLVVEKLEGENSKMTVDQYAKAAIPQLETGMKNYRSIEKKKLAKAGREYYRTIFTWENGGIELQVEQNYWVKNGNAYVMTFTTERNRFAKDRKIGSQILNSFALK